MIGMLSPHALAAVVWGITNSVLVVAIGNELDWQARPQPDIPPVKALAPGNVEGVELPEYVMPPLEKSFGATRTRPLFVPTRRPPPPPPPRQPPPKPTMQRGQFQLIGTIISEEGNSAYLKEIASGKVRQVHQGYSINDIVLETVEPDRVSLTQYGEREQLQLKIQPSPKPSPATTATAGRPGQPGTAQAVPGQTPRAQVLTPRPSWPRTATPGQPSADAPAGAPQQPPPAARRPQTMEDRLRNPILRDFYK